MSSATLVADDVRDAGASFGTDATRNAAAAVMRTRSENAEKHCARPTQKLNARPASSLMALALMHGPVDTKSVLS